MNEKIEYFVENKLPKIINKYSENEIYEILKKRDDNIFSDKWMEIFENIKK